MSIFASNILYFVMMSLIFVAAVDLAPQKYRKAILLVFNLVFYIGVSGWLNAIVLAAIILYTYYVAERLHSRKKVTVFIAVIPVIGILFFFKYFGFVASWIEKSISISVLMPLGMSFFALKAISYMIDQKREKYEQIPLMDYILYVSLFTQIISGPIQRANEFEESLVKEGIGFKRSMVSDGLSRILVGIFKKTVIASSASVYTYYIFGNPSNYPAVALWIGIVVYVVELYADFSGYSDIAIGLSLLMGLKTSENFVRPFFSVSTKEMWTRWHISLSSWLQEYVYFSMGGSRCSKLRRNINLIITFAVSGLWHGTGLTYLVWGVSQGILNMLSPSKKTVEVIRSKTFYRVPAILATNICFWFSVVVFRSDNLQKAGQYLSGMFHNFSLSYVSISQALLPFTNDNTCAIAALTLFVFIFILFLYDLWMEKGSKTNGKWNLQPIWQFIFMVSFILFGYFGESGFIYAQF